MSALQSFSKPARERWKVRWVSDGDFEFEFAGDSSLYRYWDATRCVEFSYRMAEQSLEQDLRGETIFLMQYDEVLRAINDRYDIPEKDLATILLRAFDQRGKVSNATRKQFTHVVTDEVFDFIDATIQEAFAAAARLTSPLHADASGARSSRR